MLDACSGAADAGEGLTWRNPLNCSVNVLAMLPEGSRERGGNQRDWSAAPCESHIAVVGFAGTTPLILISKRRKRPEMNFSFCIQKSICKTSLIDPLHLCLTWVSEQELAKERFGVEKGDLAELCLNDRFQPSYSRASPGWSSCSTCRTTFEGWEGSSLLPFTSSQSKDAFWGSGVPLCWWREG